MKKEQTEFGKKAARTGEKWGIRPKIERGGEHTQMIEEEKKKKQTLGERLQEHRERKKEK